MSSSEIAEMARGVLDGVEHAAEAVNELFANHQDWVYAVCLRFMGDPERSRDLAQDTLVVAYNKLIDFRGESQFKTWLYGIAKRLCLNALRRRSEIAAADDGLFDATDPACSALANMRRSEREALIRDAVAAALEPLEQEAVSLRYIDEVPQDRITQILGLTSASGARGLLQTARRKLDREVRRRLVALGHSHSFFESSVS